MVYAFFVVSAVLIAGFIASVLLIKYGIPDSMFLIGLGILIGPVFKLLDTSEFVTLAPYIGALALVAIMFESSLGINLHELIETARPAVMLALLSFFLSMSVSAAFVHFILDIPWIYSILYGSIVGGSSGAVVAAMATKIGLSGSIGLILSLESILTDVFCIVSSLVVLMILVSPLTGIAATPEQIGGFVASKFSVSIILGFVCGLVLSSILYKVRKYKHIYTAVFATLIFLYAITEFLAGSGAIAVLTAGIILANLEHMPSFLSSEEKTETLRFQRVFLESFHSELTLLIKVFFFVVVGLMINVENPFNLLLAAILSILFLLVRFPATYVITKLARLGKMAPIMTVFYGRGLAAAVLVFIAIDTLNGSIPKPEFFLESVSGIVLITNVILTVGATLLRRRFHMAY
ncbi:MAG: cation:proton antiporter [Candidatus Geothermarchaeales archaeon]